MKMFRLIKQSRCSAALNWEFGIVGKQRATAPMIGFQLVQESLQSREFAFSFPFLNSRSSGPETCSDWIRSVVAGAAETPSHTNPQVALLLFKPLVQNKMWRTISADTMVPTHADNNGVNLYSVLAASYWCPLHCKREGGGFTHGKLSWLVESMCRIV